MQSLALTKYSPALIYRSMDSLHYQGESGCPTLPWPGVPGIPVTYAIEQVDIWRTHTISMNPIQSAQEPVERTRSSSRRPRGFHGDPHLEEQRSRVGEAASFEAKLSLEAGVRRMNLNQQSKAKVVNPF